MDVRSMRCEEVRALLPEYVGEDEVYPRPIQAHLATCTACALEESRYAGLLQTVRGLRDHGELTPAGFAERALQRLDRELAWRRRVRRLTRDPRARVAAVGIGGVVVGAAAIALLVRRRAFRRTSKAIAAAPTTTPPIPAAATRARGSRARRRARLRQASSRSSPWRVRSANPAGVSSSWSRSASTVWSSPAYRDSSSAQAVHVAR